MHTLSFRQYRSTRQVSVHNSLRVRVNVDQSVWLCLREQSGKRPKTDWDNLRQSHDTEACHKLWKFFEALKKSLVLCTGLNFVLQISIQAEYMPANNYCFHWFAVSVQLSLSQIYNSSANHKCGCRKIHSLVKLTLFCSIPWLSHAHASFIATPFCLCVSFAISWGCWETIFLSTTFIITISVQCQFIASRSNSFIAIQAQHIFFFICTQLKSYFQCII